MPTKLNSNKIQTFYLIIDHVWYEKQNNFWKWIEGNKSGKQVHISKFDARWILFANWQNWLIE